jgi:hypothetical protein
MFKKYARVITIALVAVMVLSCAAFAAPKTKAKRVKKSYKMAKVVKAPKKLVLLQSPNWEPHAKLVLNQMLTLYGYGGAKHTENPRPYAVFDCDNSITILDVEEQLAIYQLEHLRFAVKPDQMYNVLVTGVPDVNKDLGEDYGHTTVAKVAKDAAAAYAKLYAKGWVKADRSQEKHMSEWMATDDWKEFATKARWLYDAIDDNFDSRVAYPWITYWFAGMTPKQCQALATESHKFYSSLVAKYPSAWKKMKWTSPANYPGSEGGQVTIGFNQGITVTPELKELFAALDADGIDAWINSASYLDVIKPVPGVFGLKGVDGIVAMTNIVEKGKITNKYDYALHDQTQGIGKSTTIVKCIAPKYKGRGPILGVFDSQGDFNFVTEFKDTAVGLCLNRQRKDDAALCAAIAIWQDKNNIDLKKAQAMGDTRYVLQGRNENVGQLWARMRHGSLQRKKEFSARRVRSGLHCLTAVCHRKTSSTTTQSSKTTTKCSTATRPDNI